MPFDDTRGTERRAGLGWWGEVEVSLIWACSVLGAHEAASEVTESVLLASETYHDDVFHCI